MTDQEKKQIDIMRKEGLKYIEIAALLEISLNTVKSYCRRNGIITQNEDINKSNLPEINHCQYCGKAFVQSKVGKPKKFCCEKCRRDWWNKHKDQSKRKTYYKFICVQCGAEFKSYGSSSRKFCSHECYIKHRFNRRDSSDH